MSDGRAKKAAGRAEQGARPRPSRRFDPPVEDGDPRRSHFHHVLVALHALHNWPTWGVALAGVGLAGGIGGVWWLLSRDVALSAGVGVLLLACCAADAYLLRQLPRRGLSFASWKAQIAALALPRGAAALATAAAGVWLGWTVALALAALAQLVGAVALYRGALVEPARLGLSELTVATDRWPSDAPPIRIFHVSDIHLERLGRREAQLLKLAQTARPDLILMTGDYVSTSNNRDPETHRQVRDLLGQLQARYGVYAVLGSPMVDLHAVIPALFDGLAIRLLRDETAALTLDDGRCLTLVGLDCHHDIPRDAATLARVLDGAPDAGPRILLYHSPELMPQAVAHGLDLYLCGHTHGGQVRLPLIGALLTSSRLGRRYVMGHYREGRTSLYISRGVGFEGLSAPRVRFLCPPEIALITLTTTTPPASPARGG
ncbi:metallophosphoesterase [Promineifilum sp.]|uniref:metallophosphoesterase n=1 Tax=Promineifilum sp. TaxID=2664178 RepID=UPI0035ADA5CA